ncbi:hypothetical protein [Pseudothioclava arenosa]|nr:hypothetical protein [Pseudothioclava arenosa]
MNKDSDPAETIELRATLERLAEELNRMAASAAQVQDALSFGRPTIQLSPQSVRDIQALDTITQKLEDLAHFSLAAAHAIPSAILLEKTAVFGGLRLHELVNTLDPYVNLCKSHADQGGVEWL